MISEHDEEAVLQRFSDTSLMLAPKTPFFQHLLLKLNPRVSRRIPTMAVTRDRYVYINPEYSASISDADFAAGIIHELLHLVFLYFKRQGSRHSMVRFKNAQGQQSAPIPLWNVAHDYAINLILKDLETRLGSNVLALSPGDLYDEKYRDMSGEEIYDQLRDELEADGDDNNDGRVQQVVSAAGEGVADCLPGRGEGEGEGEEGQGSDPFEANLMGQGGRPGGPSNEDLDDFWDIALFEAEAVEQSRKSQGWIPGSLQKRLDELRDPRVPWSEVLSKWVGENGRKPDSTWKRRSRRAAGLRMILPGIRKHGVDDMVVLWDTSGSMNTRETEILSEIIGICEDLGLSLRVICVDSAIHSDQKDVTEPEDVDVRGGGGSDFRPAFDRLHEEEYEGVVIAFTDGYISVPNLKPTHIRDCLWVIWEGDVDPTSGSWGEVIRIGKDGKVSRK